VLIFALHSALHGRLPAVLIERGLLRWWFLYRHILSDHPQRAVIAAHPSADFSTAFVETVAPTHNLPTNCLRPDPAAVNSEANNVKPDGLGPDLETHPGAVDKAAIDEAISRPDVSKTQRQTHACSLDTDHAQAVVRALHSALSLPYRVPHSRALCIEDGETHCCADASPYSKAQPIAHADAIPCSYGRSHGSADCSTFRVPDDASLGTTDSPPHYHAHDGNAVPV